MMTAPDFQHQQVIVAFLSRGDKLSFKNDNIIINDSKGAIKHQSTCYKLFALFVVGHCQITSGLLQKAEKFKFSIILMGHNLNVYAQFNNATEGNVLLRKKQYTYTDLHIARHLVTNKIAQQLAVLFHIRKKSPEITQTITKLKEYLEKIPHAIELQTLLGIEGIASRIYFRALFQNYNWQARRPRVKNDTTNTLLDIAYTLLFRFIEGLLNLYGFDIYQGVYHKNFYQRKSLVCDLVEPFRPMIDSRIYKAYCLGKIHEQDFDKLQGQYRLFGKKAEPYIKWILEEMIKYKNTMFFYIQSYYRAFIREKPISDFPLFDKFKT